MAKSTWVNAAQDVSSLLARAEYWRGVGDEEAEWAALEEAKRQLIAAAKLAKSA